jgi:uncharacterized protein YndB with AHSA1/START domain
VSVPEFDDQIHCAAPPIEVWKLLHDPARLPEWWAGVARTEQAADGAVTRYMEQWPDFAYPTRIETRQEGSRVIISCLLSDIEHRWTLEPAEAGGCTARIHVTIPDQEAPRLEALRREVAASLPRLAAAADASALDTGHH